jgi:hypothetical protein
MLEILKILLRERKSKVSELQQRLNMNKKSFESLVYLLEYLGVIKVESETVSMPSQVYSVLFEPLLIHEGTEQLIREILTGGTRFRGEDLKIPAMIVPLLLLRSVIPYFGLILRDAEKEGELKLASQKKEFLYDFFSPFKFDYKDSLEKWSKMSFTADEFYDLWFLLNRRLPTIIQTKSKYVIPITKEKKERRPESRKRARAYHLDKGIIKGVDKEKINEISPHEIDDRFYNIPLESLKAFFRLEDTKKGKIIHNDIDYPKADLRKLIKVDIDLEKILEYVKHVKKSKGQITLNVYTNGVLKWEYFDDKGHVPPLFLTPDGIYGNNNDLSRFSKQMVKRQSEYLLKLTERIIGGKRFGRSNG